ncbi:MAG: translational GTPase TypA [Candidatus Peribacteraceae bacterium]|nr:translational GTPase TypA [Candidatus Peribacteraceae bacterium]
MQYRTIAIIAHIDHGKTTLVDQILRQGGAFNSHEEIGERVMDSNEQEKERGITIYAKNCSILYKGSKINIVDTPGHADFGSEVERVLRMCDCVALLVDAFDGPMPQTRFVLKKSLEIGIKPIVIINKIDRVGSDPEKALSQVFDLFIQLGAHDDQLDFPYVFAVGRDGIAKRKMSDESKNLDPLFDLICEHITPKGTDAEAPLLLQPVNLSYDPYSGRMAVGRISQGTVKKNQTVYLIKPDGTRKAGRITKIYVYSGIREVEVESAAAGDVVMLAGLPEVYVGDTIAEKEDAEPLPALTIDPPTVAMDFMVNNSPFAGKEGKLVTTRHIRERLEQELETNVGLQIEFGERSDAFRVSGRGEMHLGVLIESMRREGFELAVSRPEVILHKENGIQMEPMETAFIDVPEAYVGTVIEKLGKRKGMMQNMETKHGITRLTYDIPTRGLLGFRNEFVIDTRGDGILTHAFKCYAPYVGEMPGRTTGSIISDITGQSVAYAIWQLQDRGAFFIGSGVPVYEGMIIGESPNGLDIMVNIGKEKRLSNVRASGTDEAIRLIPPRIMTLDMALEYIEDDELVEVTPKSIRLRKKILNATDRKRESKKA